MTQKEEISYVVKTLSTGRKIKILLGEVDGMTVADVSGIGFEFQGSPEYKEGLEAATKLVKFVSKKLAGYNGNGTSQSTR